MTDQEVEKLQKQRDEYKAALEECLAWFENRYDVVDGSYGESRPNDEMRMGTFINEALGRERY